MVRQRINNLLTRASNGPIMCRYIDLFSLFQRVSKSMYIFKIPYGPHLYMAKDSSLIFDIIVYCGVALFLIEHKKIELNLEKI